MHTNYRFLGTEILSGSQKNIINHIFTISDTYITNIADYIGENNDSNFNECLSYDLKTHTYFYLAVKCKNVFNNFANDIIMSYIGSGSINSDNINNINANDRDKIKNTILIEHLNKWLYSCMISIFSKYSIIPIKEKDKFFNDLRYDAICLGDREEILEKLGLSKLTDLIESTTNEINEHYDNDYLREVSFKDEYYMNFFFNYIQKSGNIDLDEIRNKVQNLSTLIDAIDSLFRNIISHISDESMTQGIFDYLDGLKFKSETKVETVTITSIV